MPSPNLDRHLPEHERLFALHAPEQLADPGLPDLNELDHGAVGRLLDLSRSPNLRRTHLALEDQVDPAGQAGLLPMHQLPTTIRDTTR